MKSSYRRSDRPARLAAAISPGDSFTLEPRGEGIGRFIFVVLLLHAIVIGGAAAYKWVNPDGVVLGVGKGEKERVVEREIPPPVKVPAAYDAEELLGARKTSGEPIIVDHPDMEGFKRYRVGEGEQLVEIVRQFNASVAEVEKLNNLKPGDPLFTGQWLTIPDNTGNGGASATPAVATPLKAKVIEPAKGGAGAKPSTGGPSATPGASGATKVPVPSPAPVAAGKSYQVVRGDTAYSIARRYGVDWKELLRVNGLTDPRQLRADQVIRIP